jgi:hypothetical protein
MKQLLIISLLFVGLQSCNKQNEMQKDFECAGTAKLKNSESVQDFQKKFKINIPKNWKVKYFYNDYQTTLMTADTLKPLSKSIILDVSLNNGELKVDDDIKNIVIRNIISKEHLRIKKFKKGKLYDKPAVWVLAKGNRNGMQYHLLKVLSKRSDDKYYQIEAQIYGDSLIDKRVCNAASIIKTLKDIPLK